MKNLTIIIDSAHGSNTPGKCSPDLRHREYIWSRARVKALKARLEALGYSVFLTVPEETEPGLLVRVNRANAVPGKNKLMVSLHNNAAGNEGKWMNATGWGIYTTKGKTRSDLCAEVMYDELRRVFPELVMRVDMSDGDKDKEENFTVLMGQSYMAVLIEWMFQDAKPDLAIIENASYNDKFVAALVSAIEKLNSDPSVIR